MSVVVLDIGGTAIKYGVVKERLLQFPVIHVPTFLHHPQNGEEARSMILDAVFCIIDDLSHKYRDITGIGIASAGVIDGEGTVTYANDNLPGWTGVAIGSIVKERFQLPVLVANDVRAAAIGEWSEMQSDDDLAGSCFLYLSIGTGIGGALIHDGTVLQGANNVAGHVGHFCLVPDGLICGCGLRGCFEAYASASALIRYASEAMGSNVIQEAKDILLEVDKGTPWALEAYGKWTGFLAKGLASLINILDPSYIVIGGGVSQYPPLVKELYKRLESLLYPAVHVVRLSKASLGDASALLGMAFLIQKEEIKKQGIATRG